MIEDAHVKGKYDESRVFCCRAVICKSRVDVLVFLVMEVMSFSLSSFFKKEGGKLLHKWHSIGFCANKE